MKRQKGFTVIEVMIAVIVLLTLTVFFILQRNELEMAKRDQHRKTAINSMYYALKEGYKKEKGYYPRTISRDELTFIDPTLFTDPSGYTLDGDKCVYADDDDKQQVDGKCEYHYSAINCDSNGKCADFTISADMEAESTYQKSSK